MQEGGGASEAEMVRAHSGYIDLGSSVHSLVGYDYFVIYGIAVFAYRIIWRVLRWQRKKSIMIYLIC